MITPTTSVCILDFGSGNVGSVSNLVTALGVVPTVSNTPKAIRNASHLILPGVGAYAAAMRKIVERLPLAELDIEVRDRGKPFLGICVGMQVLATRGYEFGEHSGLGWIPGTVRSLNGSELRLPHIGWNDVTWRRPDDLRAGLDETPDFYFLHSYALFPDNPASIVATSQYGEEFCSIVRSDNIVGVQFHPEKSQRAGMALLRNFLGQS
jgi:imidazole glycerol-phosphate synthase subunit HisH